MGGHGALICALKNPGQYKSVSAFAPICNPINCPWGVKAFTGYLGDDKEAWKVWLCFKTLNLISLFALLNLNVCTEWLSL